MKRLDRYLGLIAVGGTLLVMGACASDTIDGKRVGNQAPTVWLAAAPPEGSTGTYTVNLF